MAVLLTEVLLYVLSFFHQMYALAIPRRGSWSWLKKVNIQSSEARECAPKAQKL